MNQLAKRLIFSSIFISVTIFSIFRGPAWFFTGFIATFVLFGLHEYLCLVAKKGVKVFMPLALVLAALIPVTMGMNILPLLLCFTLVCLFVSYFVSGSDNEQTILGTAATIFGMVYVVWFCSHLILMRQLAEGPVWVLYTVIIIKGGDSFAYFFGKKFGKTKLLPSVSPNKSLEGAIASVAGTILISVIFSFYLEALSFLPAILFGAMVSVVAQIGDFGESLFKREVDIKDSGVIPGLGGILDILDSLTLSIPLTYFFITFALGVAS